MYAKNTGAYVPENRQRDAEEVSKEIGFKVSRENDQIDEKYGFARIKDSKERTGYLINMHSVCWITQCI
jgi:hypothetical protein